jgi:DksA/TraR C4-type zinc finger protein
LPADTTSRDRAIAALRLYRTREAVEEIEDALARLEDGAYGTCQSCDRPIPFERLEATPHVRFCALCPTPAAHPATGLPGRSRARVETSAALRLVRPVGPPPHRDQLASHASDRHLAAQRLGAVGSYDDDAGDGQPHRHSARS